MKIKYNFYSSTFHLIIKIAKRLYEQHKGLMALLEGLKMYFIDLRISKNLSLWNQAFGINLS